MKRSLITVLVTFMVAGLFFDHCDAILRAGRDRIEKFHRAMEERSQAPTAVECSGPDCYYKGTDGYRLAKTLEIFAILRKCTGNWSNCAPIKSPMMQFHTRQTQSPTRPQNSI